MAEKLTFLSQTNSTFLLISNHTLNLPPVSGAVRGISVIDLIKGVGKVKSSSVCIQVALGALRYQLCVFQTNDIAWQKRPRTDHRHLSQNSIVIDGVVRGGGCILSATTLMTAEGDDSAVAVVISLGPPLTPCVVTSTWPTGLDCDCPGEGSQSLHSTLLEPVVIADIV